MQPLKLPDGSRLRSRAFIDVSLGPTKRDDVVRICTAQLAEKCADHIIQKMTTVSDLSMTQAACKMIDVDCFVLTPEQVYEIFSEGYERGKQSGFGPRNLMEL